MSGQKILISGAAGFIGFHVAQRLLRDGHSVVGLDNLSPYYDPALKQARVAELAGEPGFRFEKTDLANRTAVATLFAGERFDRVVHLAAQPGVRYSIENPAAYVDSNLVGFANVLEGCRHGGVSHLLFASSSSVYGANKAIPYSTHQNVDHPISFYAATKKANELMAHTYAHLFGLPVTGLRFFTVYGPWGRPDMAYFLFADAILKSKPIQVFNEGRMRRDFTYVDDVVEGIVRVLARTPEGDPAWNPEKPDPARSLAPYRLYNLGNSQPVPLMDFIGAIESALGLKARLDLLPMQPGDVPDTYADMRAFEEDFDWAPRTPVTEGVSRFVSWYRNYYGV